MANNLLINTTNGVHIEIGHNSILPVVKHKSGWSTQIWQTMNYDEGVELKPQ